MITNQLELKPVGASFGSLRRTYLRLCSQLLERRSRKLPESTRVYLDNFPSKIYQIQGNFLSKYLINFFSSTSSTARGNKNNN